MNLSTNNNVETLAFGERLGRCLKPGDIILIFGDLGAGKTTLTQGICRGLGVTEEYIRSPTFTVVNEYFKTFPIYHIDLYRLESFSDIKALGLEEYLFANGVSIIEWAEKLSPEPNQVPGLGIDERIEIHIIIEEENHRSFRVEMINQNQRSLNLHVKFP